MADSSTSKTQGIFPTYFALPTDSREIRALKACGRRYVTADELDSAPDVVTDVHGDRKSALPILHTGRLVRTTPSTSEALVAADIGSSAFNGHMPPIATGPITAEVAEVPRFVHISFHLIFRNLTFDNQSDDAEIDVELLFARRVFPSEAALDGTHRTPVAASSGRRAVEPAVIKFANSTKELVNIMNVFLHLFFQGIIRSVHEMSFAI